MTSEMPIEDERYPPSTCDGLVTTPLAHTMGVRLADYVLPKVNVKGLIAARGRASIYSNQSLGLLIGGEKRVGKKFNWRRPFFVTKHGLMHCVTAPGHDYTYHYARLVSTACHLVGIEPTVEMELPRHDASVEFLDRWLPSELPACDVVVLGYVEHLFTDEISSWDLRPGFGWRCASVEKSKVMLLGCEFSYWGDLAGALVTVLAERKITPWIIYVGKLGALASDNAPNRYVATGCTSRVEERTVMWRSNLKLDSDRADDQVLTNQRHITLPSIIDETKAWYQKQVGSYDLVDPEIGRMAEAASLTEVQFDYLHIVSDNLSGYYVHGLYDERHLDIATSRLQCLTTIESILRRSFV